MDLVTDIMQIQKMNANYFTFVSHLKCPMALFTTIIGVLCVEIRLCLIRFHCLALIQKMQFHARTPSKYQHLQLELFDCLPVMSLANLINSRSHSHSHYYFREFYYVNDYFGDVRSPSVKESDLNMAYDLVSRAYGSRILS